jgi:hypothetical protein
MKKINKKKKEKKKEKKREKDEPAKPSIIENEFEMERTRLVIFTMGKLSF